MRSSFSLFASLALIACGFANPAFGQTAEKPIDEAIEAKFDRIAERLEKNLGTAPHPGAALAVLRRGEVIWFRGVGLAQVENELPITRKSSFRLGSTSKQFTAAAIALLESRGQLDLDTDIHTWFPKLPDYGHKITLRHLVHHTSGLRDYLWLHVLEGISDDDLVSPERSLAMVERQQGLQFTPGSKFSYSNTNYLMLAAIVARVSKTSFRDFVESQIFAPLEMKTARICDDRHRILPHRTAGYLRMGSQWRRYVTPLEHVGDGGVFASVDDLARWDAHFYSPTLGKDGNLVKLQRRKGPFDGYAFGLMLDTWRGQSVEMHGGAFVGYRADLVRFPEKGISFLCLGNHARFNPTGIAFGLATAWFGDELPPREAPAPKKEAKPAAADPTPSSPEPFPKELSGALNGLWSSVEFDEPCRIVYADGLLDMFFGEQQLRFPHLSGTAFGAQGFRVEFLRAGDEVLGFTLQRDGAAPHVYRPRKD